MKAGTLNAATGMIHGSINAVGNLGSAVGASIKKAALYNDETRDTLCNGLYRGIIKTYQNHKQFVNNHIKGFCEDGFDSEKALALFENAKKISAKREELLLEAIKYSPEGKKYYHIYLLTIQTKEQMCTELDNCLKWISVNMLKSLLLSLTRQTHKEILLKQK